jgi:hypothetical protein
MTSDEITAIAVGISFLSILIGFSALWLQYHHNRLSVRPIGTISLADYENRIAIKVRNDGMGTMILKSFETSDNEGNSKGYPIDWMSSGIMWANYRKGLSPIKEGDSTIFLDYVPNSQKPNFEKERQEIRSVLKNLTITIKYEDIYGVEQPILIRHLDWFGRNSTEMEKKTFPSDDNMDAM